MEDRLETIPEASSDIRFQLTNGSQSVPLYWGQKMPPASLRVFSARLSNTRG